MEVQCIKLFNLWTIDALQVHLYDNKLKAVFSGAIMALLNPKFTP